MLKSSPVPLFAVALIFCSCLGIAHSDGEAETEVPAAVKANCKWVRRDDYSKPRTVSLFSKSFKPFTELRCKEECGKRVVCGYANFNNRTRECQLIPRRAFHTSYRAAQGIYVMWEKECPIEHIWNRTDDPSQMVMCRMLPPSPTPENPSPRLSPKYAYKVAKYLDKEEEAFWWCQRDALCQGIYKNNTEGVHVFLYKAVVDEDATGDISQVRVKDCNVPASGCLFTAYNRKIVTGRPQGRPYKTIRYKNFRECYTMCLQNDGGDCYAATAEEDRFRYGRRVCRLYTADSYQGLEDFRKMFDNAKSWVRNVCQ